jgi:hypothetical protein
MFSVCHCHRFAQLGFTVTLGLVSAITISLYIFPDVIVDGHITMSYHVIVFSAAALMFIGALLLIYYRKLLNTRSRGVLITFALCEFASLHFDHTSYIGAIFIMVGYIALFYGDLFQSIRDLTWLLLTADDHAGEIKSLYEELQALSTNRDEFTAYLLHEVRTCVCACVYIYQEADLRERDRFEYR